MIDTFAYTYDSVGNRVNIVDGTGARVTWTYDGINQLLTENLSGSTGYDNVFMYDSVGNRLTKSEDGAVTTSTYDSANQLETSSDASGVTNYTFDADGNQQIVDAPNGDRTTTSWDFENQSTLVILPNGSRVTMEYNANYRRVSKKD